MCSFSAISASIRKTSISKFEGASIHPFIRLLNGAGEVRDLRGELLDVRRGGLDGRRERLPALGGVLDGVLRLDRLLPAPIHELLVRDLFFQLLF